MQLTTAPQLVTKLGVSPQTITRNAARHKIGRKLGRQWVFDAAETERLGSPVTTGETKGK
jgi:hypothetical protein